MSDDHSSDASTGEESAAQKGSGAARELLQRIRRLAARGRESAEALAQRIVRRARAVGDAGRSIPADPQALERPVRPSTVPAPPFEGELSPEKLAEVDEELPELPPD